MLNITCPWDYAVICCAAEADWYRGESRGRETSSYASVVVQEEDNDSLEWDVANGNGEKPVEFRYLYDTESKEFLMD